MNEAGLGPEAATILGQIIATNVPVKVDKKVEIHSFAHVDLGKNNLGNSGLANLLKGIMRCDSLVSLDVGSNDIMIEGASHLFKTLKRHPSLSALNIANHDRLHRNRMGIGACHDLRDCLAENKVLSSLCIADNRIGNEGLSIVAQALNSRCVLVIFNLSNNDLEGVAAIDHLKAYLSTPKIPLLDLNLSHNKLGDAAIGKLADILSENHCRLKRLNLKACQVTAQGAGRLFNRMRKSTSLQNLNLSSNDLSGPHLSSICNLLISAKQLK